MSITNPSSPTFVAQNGSLGSNCQGLVLVPNSITPQQGQQAYMACGFPYYVLGVSQYTNTLIEAIQFNIGAYPIAVNALPNGDIVAINTSGFYLYDNTAHLKKNWGNPTLSKSLSDDGAATTLVDGSAKIFAVFCGSSQITQTNCVVETAGGSLPPTATPTPIQTVTATPTPSQTVQPSPTSISYPAVRITLKADRKVVPFSGGRVNFSAKTDGSKLPYLDAQLFNADTLIKTFRLNFVRAKSIFSGQITLAKNNTSKAQKFTIMLKDVVNGVHVTGNYISLQLLPKLRR